MRMGHWWSDVDRGTPNFVIIMTGKIKVIGGRKKPVPLQLFLALIPK